MTYCVLDCSPVIAWVIPDEWDQAAETLLEAISNEGASVPSLWVLEVANALLMAERRKRIAYSERRQAIATLSGLPIQVDSRTTDQAWTETMTLAERTGLTIYDASYLELAIRKQLPLASRDSAMCKAAKALGIALV